MTINLSKDVDDEMFGQLLKAYCEAEKHGEHLTVYFTTPPGGYTDTAEAIIDFINLHTQNISMVFYGQIFSAGMIIFLKVNCEKKVVQDTVGMYHFAWQTLTITEGGQAAEGFDRFAMTEMKKAKLRTIEFLKTTTLTPTEINKIKTGKELYLSYERMVQLLNGKEQPTTK